MDCEVLALEALKAGPADVELLRRKLGKCAEAVETLAKLGVAEFKEGKWRLV